MRSRRRRIRRRMADERGDGYKETKKRKGEDTKQAACLRQHAIVVLHPVLARLIVWAQALQPCLSLTMIIVIIVIVIIIIVITLIIIIMRILPGIYIRVYTSCKN